MELLGLRDVGELVNPTNVSTDGVDDGFISFDFNKTRVKLYNDGKVKIKEGDTFGDKIDSPFKIITLSASLKSINTANNKFKKVTSKKRKRQQ